MYEHPVPQPDPIDEFVSEWEADIYEEAAETIGQLIQTAVRANLASTLKAIRDDFFWYFGGEDLEYVLKFEERKSPLLGLNDYLILIVKPDDIERSITDYSDRNAGDFETLESGAEGLDKIAEICRSGAARLRASAAEPTINEGHGHGR